MKQRFVNKFNMKKVSIKQKQVIVKK